MRKFYVKPLALGLGVLLVAAVANSGGPPTSHSGAPGERNCASCHGSVVQSPGRLTVRLGEGLTDYTPGQTYPVTVELVEPERNARMGFQLTVLNASNQRAGDLAATTPDVRLATGNVAGGQRQYVMQSAQGNRPTAANTRTWTFNWTAPAAGTGPVTFYASGLGANGNGSSDGADRTYVATLRVGEQTTTAPTITLGAVAAQYCQGQEFALDFTTSAPFASGNTFDLELSDAAGAFNAPISVGQLSGTGSGRITAAIPAQQAAGSGYRFRLRAANPVVVSEPSAPFRIANRPEIPTIVRQGNTLSVPEGFAAYQWLLNDQPIAGATENRYTPDREGRYRVRVRNTEGCEALSVPFDFVLTVRSSNTLATLWSATPNPVQDLLTLRLSGYEQVIANLYDLQGRLVWAAPVTLVDSKAQVDLQHVPAGVYQLQLRDRAGRSLGSRSVWVH